VIIAIKFFPVQVLAELPITLIKGIKRENRDKGVPGAHRGQLSHSASRVIKRDYRDKGVF